jgi:hypothetical protein
MPEPKPFDINKLFEGSLRRLRTEAEYFSRLTDHDPELGRLNETHLVRLLRDYLPPKIGIGTGFIASGGENQQQSPQCDIILYDALNNSPLYKSEAWSIYPIEMVYGVIEVKTTLNKPELRNAFEKCAKIRRMAQPSKNKWNKVYLRRINAKQTRDEKNEYQPYKDRLSPRFFVFAYNGWKRVSTLRKNFEDVSKEYGNAHVHGVCSLYNCGSLYISHVAFRKGPARISDVDECGFRHFLMNLPKRLQSALPHDHLGPGFDLIDVEHYALQSD